MRVVAISKYKGDDKFYFKGNLQGQQIDEIIIHRDRMAVLPKHKIDKSYVINIVDIVIDKNKLYGKLTKSMEI